MFLMYIITGKNKKKVIKLRKEHIVYYRLFFDAKIGQGGEEKMDKSFFRYFPQELKEEVESYGKEEIEEIRLRNNTPVFLRSLEKEIKLNFIMKPEKLAEILERMCENSIYSYQEQMCQGYIILQNGNRVGVTRKYCRNEWKCFTLIPCFEYEYSNGSRDKRVQ